MMKIRSVPLRIASTLILSVFVAGCPSSCVQSNASSQTTSGSTPAGGQRAEESPAPGSGRTPEIVEIAAGEGHTVVLTADGSVWTCGNGGDGQLGWEQTEMCFWGVRVQGLPAIRHVAAGTAYSIFLAEDGSLWGAGLGVDERLGPTDATRFTAPVELGITGWVDVAAHTNFTLGRLDDDRVVAFGVNDAGGLGSGSNADSATPVETGVSAVAVDAGGGYSLALMGDGHVKSWGMNNYATLGNPSVREMGTGGSASGAGQGFFALSPVDVVGLDHVVAISAGTEHALAVRDDGTVWGWGRSLDGSLGAAPNNTLQPAAVQIEGLSDIVAVAAGRLFGLALTRDGEVLSWGRNTHGQLGRTIGTAYSTEPQRISGLPPIARIVAGEDRSYAIDRDGGAWAWGSNEFGELLADVEGLEGPSPIVLGGAG